MHVAYIRMKILGLEGKGGNQSLEKIDLFLLVGARVKCLEIHSTGEDILHLKFGNGSRLLAHGMVYSSS